MFQFLKGYILKQLIATVVLGWLSIVTNIALGFSAILLPQLKNDKNFPYDENLASWIASISVLSMVIGSLCASTSIDGLGRKTSHIVISIICTISWLFQAFGTNNTFILIGRFIAGLSLGSIKPVSLVYLGEITDPKYRSITLVTPSFSLCLGVLIGHTLGGYIFWKTSCYIYAAGSITCLFTLLFIQESPLWLISKGETEVGIEAFKSFRGNGIDAEKELDLVLQHQSKKSERFFKENIISWSCIKPLLTVLLLSIGIQCNGVNIFTFYAQDMFETIFKGHFDPFLLMIVLDIVRVAVMIIVIFCNKFVPRKKFFLFTNFGCAIILFCLSAYLAYIDIGKHVWLSITIIVLYMAFGGGAVALSWSLCPELLPAKLRGLGSGTASAMSFLVLFIIIKITPGFMMEYGHVIMYICYGIVTTIISIILAFLLPETNERTLQDIENSYQKNNAIVSSL